jgi:hypothetical protein
MAQVLNTYLGMAFRHGSTSRSGGLLNTTSPDIVLLGNKSTKYLNIHSRYANANVAFFRQKLSFTHTTTAPSLQLGIFADLLVPAQLSLDLRQCFTAI